MSENDLFPRVQKILAEQMGIDKEEVTPESTLDGLGFDSLDKTEAVMAFEEELGVGEINDQEADKLSTATVQAICDYLAQRLRARGDAKSAGG